MGQTEQDEGAWLQELQALDGEAVPAICRVLECEPGDIQAVRPLRNGYTNQSYVFEVAGTPYVYRHPGAASAEIINRQAEYASQVIASELGIDRTFIAGDPQAGWKISRFVPDTVPFDYHDADHVAQAMALARTLHGCGRDSGFPFDVHQDTLKQLDLLDDAHRAWFEDFPQLLEAAELLDGDLRAQGVKPCLCHVDFYDANFLAGPDRMDLIDWEFSGMSDYASDLGVFICCCPDYTYQDALGIFQEYFQRPLTAQELYHCVAAAAVVSFHWLVWALYKELVNESTGALLGYYHRYARLFTDEALALREGADL